MADKILVVDDEEGIRRILEMSLTESGYDVQTAANGARAMDVVRAEHPSIVLADIEMPGMDGIELLQRIKEEDPEIEVIMMTGHADLDLAVKSLQYEAADFITKPVNFDALEVALRRVHEKIWMRSKIQEYTDDLQRLVSEQAQKLVEAERMAVIGQTVATLAHAIKNIIGGLNGGMYVLEKGIELHNEKYLHQGWGMVRGNVDKIKNLALNLLSYSKHREPNYDYCDPNIPAREVFHLMLLRAEKANISLKLDLADDIGNVVLDPEGVYCCLLNLVTNAIDACADAALISKFCEVVIRSGKADDWAVEYQVTDNGPGMDQETRSKVFRSFFSTKGTRGTGLGLMITEKIVREHGGVIELASTPGMGSTFTIRLPQRDLHPMGSKYAKPETENDNHIQ
jgi:signal transduction histidine kinase